MTDPSLGSVKDDNKLARSSSLLQGPASLRPGHWDENKPILIDATAPERAITKAQAKVMVERTAQGLQAVGLKRGDTVCVVHLNDVSRYGPSC
jgi:hypothetical protein